MIVKSISLINYRCYKSERFAFSENCNLIHGDNAQGKTNLLEAINLLCTFRPFKQVKIDDLIRFGEDVSKLKGEIETTSGLNEVHIGFNKNKKVVRLNGKILYRVSKAFGRFNVVSFLPSDIQLVKGSNSDRRRYPGGGDKPTRKRIFNGRCEKTDPDESACRVLQRGRY